MPAQFLLYEEMRVLSAKMVEAARANAWDELVELEADVAALRNRLIADGDPVADLTAEDVARKTQLIQRILDDDAEVRRHTEPWMEHVRQFLGHGVRRRDVEKAYGVSSGDAAGSRSGF